MPLFYGRAKGKVFFLFVASKKPKKTSRYESLTNIIVNTLFLSDLYDSVICSRQVFYLIFFHTFTPWNLRNEKNESRINTAT
jgi:hypothetical protein